VRDYDWTVIARRLEAIYLRPLSTGRVAPLLN